MSTPTRNRVIIKIFVGFEYSMDLKMHLDKKSEWKQASVIKDPERKNLSVVRYNDADYIGKYLDYTMLTINDIKEHTKEVRDRLKDFAPEYDVDMLKINLFPQVFVS